MRILKELGIAFLDGESLDILKAHGAEVDHSKARWCDSPPDVIEDYLSKAPSQFTLYARNPEHNLKDRWESYNMVADYPVEPVDLPPQTRHLDCGMANLTLTNKVIYAYFLGKKGKRHD